MNRKEAEDFVYKSYLKAQAYQDYHEKDSNKRRPDLTRDLIRQKAGTPCVVVTGSKGKGSVSHMISQILQTRLNVGLMTSPHIVDFCERFKINGQMITEEDFVKHINRIAPEIDEIDESVDKHICISPMGIQTNLALSYFNEQNTDFNVFECGKGAKFDDVNNVKHEFAVINSIFMEHLRELGGSLEAIAEDKSYVITGEQQCVYVAQQEPEVLEIIQKRADECQVPLKVYGKDFVAANIQYTEKGMVFDVVLADETYENLLIPVLGEHQAKNCALACAICRDILGSLEIEAVKQKLYEINMAGRMEILSSEPFTMLDACINAASCEFVKKVLGHLQITDCTVVIGIPDDKDYFGVAKSMRSLTKRIILTKSQNPHYIFTTKQVEQLAAEKIEAVWTNSVTEALELAKSFTQPIVILGTTSVISEVKSI